MGGAKRELEEAEDRGWWGKSTFVCQNCVEDDYLKQLIAGHAVSNSCSYCGRKSRKKMAAPFDVLMEVVAKTFHYYYADPTMAGVPYSGGFAIDLTPTDDALSNLPLECEGKLFSDICDSFMNDGWVEAANGHWASMHQGDALVSSWDSFVYTVKHRVRYFFQSSIKADKFDPYSNTPAQLLKVTLRPRTRQPAVQPELHQKRH